MQYRKKPVVIEAITFDELVAHGLRQSSGTVVDGVPWSFDYNDQHITHEDDGCYLIPTLEGTMKMTREDMLITGVRGEIYPCKRDIFEATYDLVHSGGKSLDVTSVADAAAGKVSDIKVVGNGDTFALLCKASSKSQGWMKSAKAMEVPDGCVVQVTTQQGDHVAEALCYVPGVMIADDINGGRKLISCTPVPTPFRS